MWLKFALIAVLPFILCISEEMMELAKMLHDNCQGETGVPEEMIENARKGDFADDDRFKCYLKCVMVQMAVMNDEGVVDPEAVVAVLPDELKDVLSGSIRACGGKVGKDQCENAWLTHKCYYEKEPEHYFLV
ncbi:general odorant-binding protein 83a isoform X2 [Agrilus planipennis]|uniref:General odorant-binding protein 83a isoform X2 n=1 Tax=Agrilus planipennis TaxID=224129 RepID=A0A7F5RMG9_AGRPL|nr:general odorant-binding protein 83a isoform X2 [Agrilus planipennis]